MIAETMKERLLIALRPSDLAATSPTKQARKSIGTRLCLIDAAIDCLIKSGYGNLSTAAVAERAGISRGTMHHHFAMRIQLVAAVVDHVFYRRMKAYLEDYFDSDETDPAALVAHATEAHWRSFNSIEHAAYFELAIAARTDPELAGFFTPAAQRYDALWLDEMTQALPHWKQHWEDMRLSHDFVIAAHTGMLMSHAVIGEHRTAQVRQTVADVVQRVFAKSMVR